MIKINSPQTSKIYNNSIELNNINMYIIIKNKIQKMEISNLSLIIVYNWKSNVYIIDEIF